MSIDDDIRSLKSMTVALRTAIEIQQEFVEAEVERIDSKIDAGFAGINKTLQTMHDQNKAVFKRLADVEDEVFRDDE